MLELVGASRPRSRISCMSVSSIACVVKRRTLRRSVATRSRLSKAAGVELSRTSDFIRYSCTRQVKDERAVRARAEEICEDDAQVRRDRQRVLTAKQLLFVAT